MANELDAELVVLGSRGRHELSSAVLGSVTGELIRRAPCPVVVVPPDAALPSQLDRGQIVCGVEAASHERPALNARADLGNEPPIELYL